MKQECSNERRQEYWIKCSECFSVRSREVIPEYLLYVVPIQKSIAHQYSLSKVDSVPFRGCDQDLLIVPSAPAGRWWMSIEMSVGKERYVYVYNHKDMKWDDSTPINYHVITFTWKRSSAPSCLLSLARSIGSKSGGIREIQEELVCGCVSITVDSSLLRLVALSIGSGRKGHNDQSAAPVL